MNTNAVAASKQQLKPGINRVTFQSEGAMLVGNLYLPSAYRTGNKLPAVVVTGSWTTVKEQMAGLYAGKLAEQGLAALAFDFRYFGESGGEPRQYESAAAKTRDIENAVTYLESVNAIDRERIGGFSVCAGSGYMVMAVAEDCRLKAYVAVAPWLHDAQLVKAIYGGDAGVRERLADAAKARAEYENGGRVAYAPAISTTDVKAAMFGDFDYYMNPNRSAIPAWSNQFAVQSWGEWLTFSAMPAAKQIRVPVLFVHSEQAAVPEGAKQFYAQVSSPKHFIWLNGSTQFDFYDQPTQVAAAVKAAAEHFGKSL